MVARGDRDWEQHKKDISEWIGRKYDLNKSRRFVDYYSHKYDGFRRSYLDWKFCLKVMDDFNDIHIVGTKFYLIYGPGGVGKSNLAKNILHFFDDKFTPKFMPPKISKFFEILKSIPSTNSLRGVGLDEPDKVISANTKEGKALADVLGKCRQQKLFLVFCATDLKDVPPLIFRKLNAIVFMPLYTTAYLFRNNPEKRIWILQDIRYKFDKEGNNIFYKNMRNKACCLKFNVRSKNVFSGTRFEHEYLVDKKKDYEVSLDDAERVLKGVDNASGVMPEKHKLILKNLEDGLSRSEVAKIFNVNPSRVSQIKSLYAKVDVSG